MHPSLVRSIVGAAVAALASAGLGGTAVASGHSGSAASVIRVPADAPTIQTAVNRATPGTLVLVAPGVYHEGVTIAPKNHDIVVRGESRARTVLDGEFSEDAGRENGFKVFADHVAIENLTVQNFVANGVFWTGVDGYRGSYLTAIRNGDYGVYAFDSTHGLFDHSYGAGSPDAGFYIGQCQPCNAVIVNVEAEWNGIGYSGTNSGGGLVIARSSFHDNRVGIVPNSGSYEEDYPESKTTIVGNTVADNNNAQTAAIEIAQTAIGNGILLAGGTKNLVAHNLVTGHDSVGIAPIPLPEKTLDPSDEDGIDFDARDNTVRDNTVRGNQYDLASIATLNDAADSGGNCFAGNTFTTSAPPDIETVLPCGKPASAAFRADLATFVSQFTAAKPPSVDYKTVVLPDLPPLRDMPKAKTAKARPAANEPSLRVNVKKVPTPSGG